MANKIPGLLNPVYDVSRAFEVKEGETDRVQEGHEQNEENSMEEKEEGKNPCSLLDFIVVSVKEENDNDSLFEEKDAIVIDDDRKPCKGDAIIDLNIDTKALFFVSFFLLATLQRIPRHYPDKLKIVLIIGQFFVMLGMCIAIAYDMGAFHATRTLTDSQWDNFVTSVKNVILNAKYPLLYLVGIFYFRSRHLENMLSNVRLTKRYWKYGRKMLIIMVLMVFLFTVMVPAIFRTAQMSLTNRENTKRTPYSIKAIVISCVISLVVRPMSLSIVFAFILTVYLIYCQVRLFKEQIQKWPRECMGFARDSYINVCKMVRNAERSFQPFLLVHFIILLVLLIPLTISCVEQFEAQGSYTNTFTKGDSIPLGTTALPAKTEMAFAQNTSASLLQFGRHQYLSRNLTKDSWMDKFNKNAKHYSEKHTNTEGIIRVAMMILTDILETVLLYGLPVVLIGKVDKCMRQIRDAIRMLKFGQQKEQSYMFQNMDDINEWESIISDARGIQLMGFNLASFKAALLMLLFPFVTTVFRFMLRHVNISP